MINMLMAEYSYETDIEVQREEAAEIATKEANERVDRKADGQRKLIRN